MVPSPWRDRKKFHQAYQYCQSVYEGLLAELGEFLNQVHGVQLGPRYWRILLGPWLLYCIDTYYDRYACLQEAVRLFPDFDTWLLDESQYRIPGDTVALVLQGTGDLYNLQLYSQILRGLGYEFFTKKIEKPAPEQGTGPGEGQAVAQSGWKEMVKKSGKLAYESIFSCSKVWFHHSSLSTRQQIRLALTPGFRGRFLHPGDLPVWNGLREEKGESRQALAQCSSQGDPFKKILVENLPRHFPELYLEGFGPWRRQLLRTWEKSGPPKILVNAAGLWFDETAKLLAAELAENGGKIFSIQHGGGYGCARLVWPEKHEREISDRFACWGWAGQEHNDKLINLPAPKLAFRQRQHRQFMRLQTILIVGNTFPRYLYRFQSHPVGRGVENYIEDLMTFLDALGETGRQRALYRGHPSDFGWQTTQRVRDRFLDVAIDDHAQPFSRRLQEARLVVLDYPDTTLLEVMAANVPLVLFFNSQIWEQRQEAVPYFDSLRRAGILQDTPRDAARQVREIYDRLDEWWFSSEIQAAHGEFAQHFALASRKWPREWVAWLRREFDCLRAASQRPPSSAPCPQPSSPTPGRN